jgi:heat shock protein HslJ
MTRVPKILLAALVAAGCATAEKEPPPKPFVGTRWQVVMEAPLPGEQPFVRFGDGRVEGFGGCNRFAARIVQDSVGARAIAIGRIEMNRRLCDQAPMSAEARMLEVLQSVSSYTVKADTMTMSGSAGMLRFKALLDEARAAPSASQPLTGTRWKGVVDAGLDPAATPWIEFMPGRMSGFTGCNLFSGEWKNEEGQVRFGPVVMTKRGCMGAPGEVERRVTAVLNEQGRAIREGAKLVIVGPGGERFEFVPG